ncbi:Nuclear polyadenylated RNA-binding protein nab2 [Ceratocystis fimbriata CBS 114723]|uniref:Nuclear polyadenylated RNA-binding protein nab2 n=1 Tax=Ceratocystis fimbriata CBS 114723 TaxID=1035309 RepID=A0A2C5X965_9PEZI|nr:Nuclear polyadenylated RNA-binding protein nab2 [Ceratocystis fimbriata CBS 114723]
MPIEVQPNTPLADALNAVVQPKLEEIGWGSGDPDDTSLAEYIVLMLVNGRSQDEIAVEISQELLGQSTDDPVAREFSQWLFAEVEAQNARLNGGNANGNGGVANTASATASDQGVFGIQQAENTLMADADSMDISGDMAQMNVPTGPRSMRNGNGNTNNRGRDRRTFNQMNKNMDRTIDGGIHRVPRGTGNERINRGSNGMNMGMGMRNNHNNMRGGRNNMNNRSASVQAGLNAAAMGQNIVNLPHGMNNNWGAPMGGHPMGGAPGQQQPSQMDLIALLEQQNRMMAQLSKQMMDNNRGGGRGGRGGGRGDHNSRRGNYGNKTWTPGGGAAKTDRSENGDAMQTEAADGEDTDMTAKRESANPEDSMCKFNLRCTNKDCKFAHQSPAAPPGTTVDIKDICSFGAACKNWKCAGRHPSPAARLAHQSEQDCKFFPNCHNPHCPFKHPSMPLCINGADCSTPDCKFTHVKTKCKFTPCLNPKCAFVHEEGQQGSFKDKVWTPAGGANGNGAEAGTEHVSERKFVIDQEEPEHIKPEDVDIA